MLILVTMLMLPYLSFHFSDSVIASLKTAYGIPDSRGNIQWCTFVSGKKHYMEAFLYLISGKNYHYQQKTRGACDMPPGTVKVSVSDLHKPRQHKKHSFPFSDSGY